MRVESSSGSVGAPSGSSSDSITSTEPTCPAARPLRELYRGGLPSELANLLENTHITTADLHIDALGIGGYKSINTTQDQLKQLVQDLALLYRLPTGKAILDTLSDLLRSQGQKLVFSFALDENKSPACKILQVSIGGKSGLYKAVIRLPEEHQDGYPLPFYSINQDKVISIQEPTFIIIGHECTHGIQNLLCPSGGVSNQVKENLRRGFPEMKFLQEGTPEHEWCRNFFGGTDPGTWSDELAVMVLGQPSLHEAKLSETKLLQELLSGDNMEIPVHLAIYRGDALIPFGHGQPGTKTDAKDLKNFKELLVESKLFPKVEPETRCLIM